MKHFLIIMFGLMCNTSHAAFVGITQDEFKPYYAQQMQTNWCWASSAAMVMAYQGIKIPQQEIVTQIKKQPVNQPAQPLEIIAAVNYVFKKTIDGVPSYIVMSGQYVLGAPLPVILYNQLKQRKPVILTYQSGPMTGHAVVITGANATFTSGKIMVDKIYVFDPFAYDQTPIGLLFDEAKVYREYPLWMTPMGLTIPGGLITGMILMNSSTTPIEGAEL